MAENTSGTVASRWRWAVQGGIYGAILAVAIAAIIGWVRADPIDPITTFYNPVDGKERIAVGGHAANIITVRDQQQPSAFPDIPGIGGDRYVVVVITIDGAAEEVDDPQGFEGLPEPRELDLGTVEFRVFAVDSSGTRKEELVPSPQSQRTLDGYPGGVIYTTDPFWLTLTYNPPTIAVDHYELELTIGDDTGTMTTERDVP
ncbi:hypothetical protein [Gulosibacter chungangensis]|uniref:Uncharacterized protein n=1 Tax=Gulosibacter chungangensis TaxID=979746 RepID=A0A7J5BFF1_9MICO|nr:hypothetical protein [Gulosibacter chungangensis]KAB1644993.1 hypothetical protein F8O05_01665 [Gulosibacter chungangensis]